MNPADPSQHPALMSRTESARLVYLERLQILDLWLKRVRAEVAGAPQNPTPILVDTMPLFIERVAESLCEETARVTPGDSSTVAQEHGGERARVTRYGPEQVIQEYQILREVIRDLILNKMTLGRREDDILQKSFDKGVQEAMIAYFLVHNRIREQFVATLTHDLRNPIGAVKLAGDLINEIVADGPVQEPLSEIGEIAKRVVRQAKRADRMIQNLLDASLVQIGEHLTMNISRCNIRDIVAEAIGERAGKELKRLKRNLIDCEGHWDADLFQRAVENLISNAFKYGDPLKEVTVTVAEANQRVIVLVHNFGPPIPVDNQANLFQVFKRAEETKGGSVKGWGIGLALVRSTAERMGGSLAVDSSVESGTTFSIDVPADSRPFQNAPLSR